MATEATMEDNISSYGHVGGLIGAQMNSSTYENCNVENCKITCGRIGAAGLISYMGGTTIVKDSTVKNVELIDNWENSQGEVILL